MELGQESYYDAGKIKSFTTRAMLYVVNNLRAIEARGYNDPASAIQMDNTEQLLWQMFKHPRVPAPERLEWVAQGIYYLRGNFLSAEYLASAAENYITTQPLTVALYRDLLVEWSGLHREVLGQKAGRDQFTSFEAMLLTRFEATTKTKPPAQCFRPLEFWPDKVVVVKL